MPFCDRYDLAAPVHHLYHLRHPIKCYLPTHPSNTPALSAGLDGSTKNRVKEISNRGLLTGAIFSHFLTQKGLSIST